MSTKVENKLKKTTKENSLLWRLLRESIPQQKFRYGVAMIAMVITAATAALAAWSMGEIVDAMTNPDNRARTIGVAGLVLLIFLVRGASGYVQAVFLARAGNSIIAKNQKAMYDKLLRQGVSFFTEYQSSEILLRVTKAAERARKVVDTVVTGYVRDLLTLVGLIAIMIYQQPILSAVWLIVGPLVFIGLRFLMRRMDHLLKQELGGMSEIIKVTQETSIGVRVIKAFSMEKHMKARMDDAVKSVQKKRNKLVQLKSATEPLLNTLVGLAIASIVVLSTINIFGSDPATPGQLMSFVTALLMAYEPAKRISRMRMEIHHGMTGVRMLYELIDHPVSLKENPEAIDLQPIVGQVSFENVSFGYNEREPFIKNLTFDFAPGQTTALVGASGSGKSTLFNLIMRLYDPQEGQVLIDGQNIRNATFHSLRKHMSYVGQETFLFSTTVKENIRVGRPGATDDEVITAARVANAHEFIEELPKGYETRVGENGANLSGGQRQRISIARAVLKEAEILLLDEATSALDGYSETLVRDAIDNITKGKTTIMIAHRLSTIMKADQVIYLENGRIIEVGSIDQLLRMEDGYFRKLFDEQYSEVHDFKARSIE